MDILDRIKHHFSESIQTTIATADALLPIIHYAGQRIVQCLLEGHKIMACGNGGSAYDAMRFSSHMLNRFQYERPGLPAIALTADSATISTLTNETSLQDLFAKPIRALGTSGDLLLALSPNGNMVNMLQAVKAAQDRKISVIALTGHDGGKIAGLLTDNDIEIRVPATETPRIQETHLLILHCLCDMVDFQLFGHGDTSS